ncbi:MAG TPA: hypothetical protein VLE44_02950 [Candidatus Saccharimonadales bacterium]|nr:hypothetical protein [Candidatus Saccharimonadales bacterium]
MADKIQKNVFDVGGFLLGYSIKYDGHFLLITDFTPVKNDSGKVFDLELFIIDGRGEDGKGMIGRVKTSQYSPYYEMIGDRKIWTTGFRGLMGIVPK